MKKRPYRSIKLEEVKWDELQQKANGQALIFPIDIAKHDNFGILMTQDREDLVTIAWKHPQQTGLLVNELVKTFKENQLEVIMEPTSTYGDPVKYLFEKKNIPVYLANPKRTHDAREVYDSVPSSHDVKSAAIIGWLHLEGLTKRWQEESDQQVGLKRKLKELNKYQDRFMSSLNHLEARLARHWPEVTEYLSLDSVTLLTLLTTYGSPAEISLKRENASKLMQRTGRSMLSAEKCESVLESAMNTIGVPCLKEEYRELKLVAEDMLEQKARIKTIEKELKEKLNSDELLERMSKVLGGVTCIVFLAALGDPHSYPSSGHYLKALGLNLKEQSSGKYKGQLKITKRGNSLTRRYLYWAALRWMKQETNVSDWCEAKAKRDGGSKGKAIVAVMRKLSKAVWSVANGAEFDSKKLFNPSKLKFAA